MMMYATIWQFMSNVGG